MTLQEAIAELRCFQRDLDPEGSERAADMHEAIDAVLRELSRLRGNEFVRGEREQHDRI